MAPMGLVGEVIRKRQIPRVKSVREKLVKAEWQSCLVRPVPEPFLRSLNMTENFWHCIQFFVNQRAVSIALVYLVLISPTEFSSHPSYLPLRLRDTIFRYMITDSYRVASKVNEH